MILVAKPPVLHSSDVETGAAPGSRKHHADDAIWYCREAWFGDSRDGQLVNGDGYHYFQMRGSGIIEKAIEWYETEDGEEHTTDVPELTGINWFEFFGYEDDELLESIPAHEFAYVEQLAANKK